MFYIDGLTGTIAGFCDCFLDVAVMIHLLLLFLSFSFFFSFFIDPFVCLLVG